MAKGKRRIALFLANLILLPLLLTGCFNYYDINKVTFPTSVIFDVDDLGQAIVYLDCIKPYRSTNDSSDKGRRIIYKGQGKTALEALVDINRVSSYKLDYSQTRAYIFTEKAARKGIKKFLDLINNNSEFSMKPSAFVYYGDVEDLLKTVSTDEEYLGLFLNDLIGKERYNPKAVKSNINYYLSNTLMGSNTALLTSIALKENAIDKKIEIDGASIFKDNILVEKIDVENSLMYNLLMGTVKTGTLEVTNPQSKENFVTLEILDSSIKDTLSYEEGRFKLIKDINVEVSISEIQGNLIVDTSVLDYIKVNKEAYINGYAEFIFNKYKEKDLDIFDIKRMEEMYYPKEGIDDPLSITDLEVNTNLIIKGTGVTKDSI
ncbi:Ger(x)C family spore germination protein [Clostridioides difficile]